MTILIWTQSLVLWVACQPTVRAHGGHLHTAPKVVIQTFEFSLSFLCEGSSTVIQNFRLSDIIPPSKELHNYYRYVGSMTTPGCEQAVAWTVFHRTLSISSRQVSSFSYFRFEKYLICSLISGNSS